MRTIQVRFIMGLECFGIRVPLAKPLGDDWVELIKKLAEHYDRTGEQYFAVITENCNLDIFPLNETYQEVSYDALEYLLLSIIGDGDVHIEMSGGIIAV